MVCRFGVIKIHPGGSMSQVQLNEGSGAGVQDLGLRATAGSHPLAWRRGTEVGDDREEAVRRAGSKRKC